MGRLRTKGLVEEAALRPALKVVRQGSCHHMRSHVFGGAGVVFRTWVGMEGNG